MPCSTPSPARRVRSRNRDWATKYVPHPAGPSSRASTIVVTAPATVTAIRLPAPMTAPPVSGRGAGFGMPALTVVCAWGLIRVRVSRAADDRRPGAPLNLSIDVVIPTYQGWELTERCL